MRGGIGVSLRFQEGARERRAKIFTSSVEPNFSFNGLSPTQEIDAVWLWVAVPARIESSPGPQYLPQLPTAGFHQGWGDVMVSFRGFHQSLMRHVNSNLIHKGIITSIARPRQNMQPQEWNLESHFCIDHAQLGGGSTWNPQPIIT